MIYCKKSKKSKFPIEFCFFLFYNESVVVKEMTMKMMHSIVFEKKAKKSVDFRNTFCYSTIATEKRMHKMRPFKKC